MSRLESLRHRIDQVQRTVSVSDSEEFVRPRSDADWHSLFCQLNEKGLFAQEPDIVEALECYRRVIDQVPAEILPHLHDPPLHSDPEYYERKKAIDNAFTRLCDMLERANRNEPGFRLRELQELVRWHDEHPEAFLDEPIVYSFKKEIESKLRYTFNKYHWDNRFALDAIRLIRERQSHWTARNVPTETLPCSPDEEDVERG